MQGNGPPPNVSPPTLVEFLKQRPRASKVVCLADSIPEARGTIYENIRIVVPPSNCKTAAQLSAHKRMLKEFKNLEEWKTETGSAMLGDYCAKEALAQMLFGVEEYQPGKFGRHFVSSEDLEKLFTEDEIAVLFSLCMQVQLELGPRLQVLTDAEVDSWIEVLKEGFDPLAYLQSPDLVMLVRGLHRRVVAEQAKSTGFQNQDSPLSSSLNTSELTSPTYATDTTSFGEQRELPSVGTTSSDPIDDAEALALARRMAGKTTTSE